VSCHGTGAQGAPKIGDRQAWSERASKGLTSLTQSALKGLRAMPAHGGKPDLGDLEIGRAIAYMVNQSGGQWVEPASLKDMAAERSGEQVVRQQCARCHIDGVGGAPKIGDRDAWTPRLKDGLDRAIRTAIRGHGGMPPRGDRADLTDDEIRHAVFYMINPQAAAAPGVPALREPALYRSVDGMDLHVGFVPAETMRVFPEGSVERAMHGGVPRGSGYYHVNVSLLDSSTKERISDAKLDIRVEQPGASGVTKTLEPVVINNAPSYGNYIRLRGRSAYQITVRVLKPDSPRPVEAKFEHRTY
jgi:cytochrome c5